MKYEQPSKCIPDTLNKTDEQQQTTSSVLLDCFQSCNIINKVTNFILQKNFKTYAPLSVLKAQAHVFYDQEHLESATANQIKQLKIFNFFNTKNYKTKMSDEDKQNLNNFKDELIQHIHVVEEKRAGTRDPEKYKLKRMVNPPLEAYEYQ
jgi:hypothetical protein